MASSSACSRRRSTRRSHATRSATSCSSTTAELPLGVEDRDERVPAVAGGEELGPRRRDEGATARPEAAARVEDRPREARLEAAGDRGAATLVGIAEEGRQHVVGVPPPAPELEHLRRPALDGPVDEPAGEPAAAADG